MKIGKIKRLYRSLLRARLDKKYRKNIKNKDCSIISMNCVGGVVSHQLGLRFNSPTVNLWFEPAVFVRFLNNLDYYLHDCKIKEDVETSKIAGYPVGMLDDIKIYFMHYDSIEQAKQKWEERLARLNSNNLYFVMVQRDECSDQDILMFDKLKFKHKVVFTAKEYPEIKSAYYIPHCEENENCVRDLIDYKNKFTGKRWLDEFDWITFLNDR